MSSSNQEPKKEPESPHHFGEGFFQFIMNNKWDAFAYLILFIGLLLSIFERFTGGLIVGFILGIYFSREMREELAKFKEFLAHEGVFRGFVLVSAGIALFIASPGLCIGTGVGAVLRPYLGNVQK